MKAVLRDRDGRVEAVCHDMEFLARRIGDRPIERVDVWPVRGTDSSQVGIALADGASTIFDLPVVPDFVCWVINRWGRPNGWPQPTIHPLITPERRKDDA